MRVSEVQLEDDGEGGDEGEGEGDPRRRGMGEADLWIESPMKARARPLRRGISSSNAADEAR
jgi:hypothetical protein